MNNSPDDANASSAPLEKKPDIRVSAHSDLGVEVTRDLTEGGRLARGDRSNMSRLSFSSRGRAREELDPELQALRPQATEAPISSKERRERAEAAEKALAEEAERAEGAKATVKALADAAEEAKAQADKNKESNEGDGLFAKLKHLFGG